MTRFDVTSVSRQDSAAQTLEIRRIGGDRGSGLSTFEHQVSQVLPVAIVTDEFADVCATSCESPIGDLFVDELLERGRKGDAHRAHVARVAVCRMTGSSTSWENRPELESGEKP